MMGNLEMEDREEIIRLNFEYNKKFLEKDPDETRRQILMRYLDEERARLSRKRGFGLTHCPNSWR